MPNLNTRVIRRHKRRTDDGKGLRRLIAGRRFRMPVGVTPLEAESRFLTIERVWRDNETFCRRIGRELDWTGIALWAAESYRKGDLGVVLPPIDDVLSSYGDSEWPAR